MAKSPCCVWFMTNLMSALVKLRFISLGLLLIFLQHNLSYGSVSTTRQTLAVPPPSPCNGTWVRGGGDMLQTPSVSPGNLQNIPLLSPGTRNILYSHAMIQIRQVLAVTQQLRSTAPSAPAKQLAQERASEICCMSSSGTFVGYQ